MQYQTESPSSVFSCQGIVHELFGLAIKDFFSRHAFIERFDSLVQNYNDITTPPLDGTIEVHHKHCHGHCDGLGQNHIVPSFSCFLEMTRTVLYNQIL